MRHFLKHLFLPRHTNNQRAKLLHQETILLIVGILFLGSLVIGGVKHVDPHVLGVSVDMSISDLLNLTNIQRKQANLPALTENTELEKAAQAKAQDMFAENYWAHNAPSGKTPWDFIHNAGYNYIYAGENLARGFSTASDTVNAWMASPDHRANILSQNYTDVGFAVAEGSLTGDPNTVLVVEEFGSTSYPNPQNQPPQAVTPSVAPVAQPVTPAPVLGNQAFQSLTSLHASPIIDVAFWAKALAIGLLALFLLTFLIDFVIVGRKQMVRIVGHNADHVLFLLGILLIAYLLGGGIIF